MAVRIVKYANTSWYRHAINRYHSRDHCAIDRNTHTTEHEVYAEYERKELQRVKLVGAGCSGFDMNWSLVFLAIVFFVKIVVNEGHVNLDWLRRHCYSHHSLEECRKSSIPQLSKQVLWCYALHKLLIAVVLVYSKLYVTQSYTYLAQLCFDRLGRTTMHMKALASQVFFQAFHDDKGVLKWVSITNTNYLHVWCNCKDFNNTQSTGG